MSIVGQEVFINRIGVLTENTEDYQMFAIHVTSIVKLVITKLRVIALIALMDFINGNRSCNFVKMFVHMEAIEILGWANI